MTFGAENPNIPPIGFDAGFFASTGTSTGAGAGSQHSVGFGVLGGVISSTLLGIFFIPVFFVWIRSIFKYKPKKQNNQEQTS